MANVLPTQARTELKRNYVLRLVAAFSLLFTGAMLIGATSLIPAYIASRSQLTEIQQYEEIEGEAREASRAGSILEMSRLVNTQIEALNAADQTNARTAIEHVMRNWESHANDIIISGFGYTLEIEKKENVPELRISGEARDREALNAFVQTLRADTTFDEVQFPVSDLAGGEILKFSITLRFPGV